MKSQLFSVYVDIVLPLTLIRDLASFLIMFLNSFIYCINCDTL